MATTIKSSALDFANIKESLKTYLKAQSEFSDYDFEGSGLSNILDVLAYNTHLNALTANFTLNESFLGTAQLRSSVVSLATAVGYIPDTKTSARAFVRASVNLSGATTQPTVIDLPRYTRFRTTVDEVTYTFQTIETYTATNNGNGLYVFEDGDGNSNIRIYEGTRKTKTFLVGKYSETDVYIIPDVNLDGDTVRVDVYDSTSSASYVTYSNIVNATSINENSTVYILKEAPNGFYQLSFGANDSLGRAPTAGNKIVVSYLSTAGANANTGGSFTPIDSVTIDGTSYPITATTLTRAAGGDVKESIESIRRNAPFQYATQNRMVTAEDYTSLILRNYSTLIKDIKSWGGQDNPKPKFGTVYSSILFEDDVTDTQIADVKNQIYDLVNQLAVLSFNVEYADPVQTYLEADVYFQINPKLTPLSVNSLKTEVKNTIANYFTTNLGGFDKSFRRSNLLSLVDDISPAILSSRANIRMQQRINPSPLTARKSYELIFPVQIAEPSSTQEAVITSSPFTFNNSTCIIRNKLQKNQTAASTVLQIVEVGTGAVKFSNIGEYFPSTRKVTITSLKIQGLLGGSNYIKISAIPANQSAITPVLNDILLYDEGVSATIPVIVSADN